MIGNVEDLLSLRAGTGALAVLRDQGFSPDLFTTMLGASGGPKWLVLRHIDSVLADTIIAPRTRPLDVVGSSIGTFRHLCFASGEYESISPLFQDAYVGQAYEEKPEPELVSRVSAEIVDLVLGNGRCRKILDNPLVRTHIITARLRTKLSNGSVAFKAAIAAAAAANAVSRKALGSFFERIVFSTSPVHAPRFESVPTRTVAMSENNLADAALASGSIPIVMSPVLDPHGAPLGAYLDGGIIDYHYDFRFETEPSLVLYPHFFEKITPGWFDKALPWRKVRPNDLARTVMIAPSPQFIAGLPGGRVPDRNDFVELSTTDRQARWEDIVERCRKPADKLRELIEKGKLVDALRPF